MATVCAHQRECISRAQLRAIGATTRQVDTLVSSEILRRRHRGVYAFGQMEVPFAREAAALLAVPTAIALTAHSAAAVWAIAIPPAGGQRVELVARSRSTVAGLRVHEARRLSPRDVRVRHGLPVTSPAWTLLELAPTISFRELERAFDDVLVRRLARIAELTSLLKRVPGRRGAPALRELVERETKPAFTRSEGERRMLELVREAGLPEPLVNARVHGYEVDFYWPQQQLVVELDGLRYHSTQRTIARDRHKDQVLRAAGLPPLRIAGVQLHRRPIAAVTVVAQALATAGG